MADVEDEELEPLFDYTRVQPVDFLSVHGDEEIDCSPCIPNAKRKKCSESSTDGKVENLAVVVEEKDQEEEEEDWLPPPPQEEIGASSALPEDEILRELRLKKEELTSIAHSAGDVMRAVMESAKREVASCSSRSDDEEAVLEEKVKPGSDKPKILISIQGKDGQKQFRMNKEEKLEKLFKMYARWAQVDLESLVFCFDGEKVNPSATPAGLGLEDDDIIEVHVRQGR
ncbi:ubiquitin-like superfamily protein [Wolffia australiana]